MKAVVLAAGKGERLWPLTETRPKTLLPLDNKPIIQHTIEALVESHLRQIILVISHKGEAIQEELGDGSPLRCEIEYVKQQTPKGTADALSVAESSLHGEDQFVVVYGDDYYEKRAIRDFLAKAKQNDGITMGTAEVNDASSFGKVDVDEGRVAQIHEKLARQGPGLVNTGLYLMTNNIFPSIKRTVKSKRGEFELTDSLKTLIDQKGSVYSNDLGHDSWVGIRYPWDLLEANRFALVEEKTRVIRGEIEDGARIEGPVIVEEGSIVKSGSRLEGPVRIGKNCEIGPNAYLRPFSTLGEDVKVGAACEVKNSIVMENTKIPHLSYIGDSIIGRRCSLGAGTITANLRFDESPIRSRVRGALVSSGKKKLGTVFGDGVKTGINVSIFPGIKIGSGAWLGPGATVEKDIESGARYTGEGFGRMRRQGKST